MMCTIVIPGLTRDLPPFFVQGAKTGRSRVKPGMTGK